jgi:MFS family permease
MSIHPGATLKARAHTQTTGAEAPQKPVGKLFMLLYMLAMIGAYASILTPAIIGLSLKMFEINPEHASQNLSLVVGIGAVFALIANPLFGRLSDRTASRFGMRRPWLIGGALAGLAALLVTANAQHLGVIVVAWSVAQLAYNAVLAAGLAVLADQVPVRQRGTVSGFLGISIGVGTLAGMFMASLFSSDLFWMFMAPGLAGGVFILLFALKLKDRRLARQDRPKFGFVVLLKSFWVNPVKHPNFGWAWISRFAVLMGIATLTTYQTYFLIQRLGVAPDDVAQRVFIAILVSTVLLVISSTLGGMLSDKLRRRKLFVVIASLLFAVGLYYIAQSESFVHFVIGIAITGLGQGMYFAVDMALVTQVLPSRKDNAKDLGVINIANSLPQSVAPAIAPVFLAIGGPANYISLFTAAALFALAGALLVLPIRGVR